MGCLYSTQIFAQGQKSAGTLCILSKNIAALTFHASRNKSVAKYLFANF